MFTALEPPDEVQRLAVLRSLGILDTPPEERFDRITRRLRDLLAVPNSILGFVDEKRVWFKSRQGIPRTETDRSISLFSYAILRKDGFHVPDTLEDGRFFDNPLVVHPPFIRMFAAHPVRSPGGFPVGALAVVDTKSRVLSAEEKRILQVMTLWVEDELFRDPQGEGSGPGDSAMDLARRLMKRLEL